MKSGTWRKEKVKGDLAVAFGNDHATGKFLMVWKLEDPSRDTMYIPNQPDDSNLIVDVDEFMGDKIADQDLIAMAAEHGFVITGKDLTE